MDGKDKFLRPRESDNPSTHTNHRRQTTLPDRLWKRCWRVSTHEGEVPLEICERGNDEAGGAERPIVATHKDGPQADSESEETSLPDAAVGQSESHEHKRTL
ncbi:hypothetical protein E2C01_045008 [Portunus trituberculatus]|uniref:Uncharacterized protein n=1 Tax=Portunus trituberculatus TaxID=210409 RepID=A0A5B7G1Z6_PORTR|nr:hypothetical protein [Portunus trituberculatus]